MTQCPKCSHVRMPHETQVHPDICPACGISYSKWQMRQRGTSPVAPKAVSDAIETEDAAEVHDTEYAERSWWTYCKDTFTEVPVRIEPAVWWGRAGVWCLLLAWAMYFASHGVDWEIIGGSFLHNINLAFHEFGHVFFAPFGRLMMILGGSLFQLLLPLGLLFAFTFYQRENFGAAVMLWWCGQSFVDLAPYIRDAEYRSLPLVGGAGEESHDWGNIMTEFNAIDSAVALGNASFTVGCVLMLLGLMWGGYILWLQHLVMRGEIVFE